MTYKDRRAGFVYFASSENRLAIAEAITVLVFPDHQYALDWLEYEKYNDPKKLARLSIEAAFMDDGIEAGLKKLKEAIPFLLLSSRFLDFLYHGFLSAFALRLLGE